jgi:hypothetical protein
MLKNNIPQIHFTSFLDFLIDFFMKSFVLIDKSLYKTFLTLIFNHAYY